MGPIRIGEDLKSGAMGQLSESFIFEEAQW